MTGPRPPAQHGVVLAGVKATPSGWPPASLDPGSGRAPISSDRERATRTDQTNSGLYGFRGLPTS